MRHYLKSEYFPDFLLDLVWIVQFTCSCHREPRETRGVLDFDKCNVDLEPGSEGSPLMAFCNLVYIFCNLIYT